jgi:hypothetical protein
MGWIARQIGPRRLFQAAVALAFAAVLVANLPGHLSNDSVAQLYEGRFHLRETWGPVLYAWLLGFFDRFAPGTGLYVVVSALLFFGSLWSFSNLRGRTSWLAAPVVALLAATPQVLIYQGIVWKDVMFANCAVAGLTCLAHAAKHWPDPRRRWRLLAAALLLLAIASQVRQNGLIVAVAAAWVLGWIGGEGRWRRGAIWGLGGFAAVAVAGAAMTVLAMPPNAPSDQEVGTGVRIVQNYDLVAAVALDPGYRLAILAQANPRDTATVTGRARADYSGRRVDFIDRDTVITKALNRLPDAAAQAQWFDLIGRRPALYLRIRWEDFRWLVLPPVIDWCLPVYVGLDAPADKMVPLKLKHRYSERDRRLNNYATWFYDTPVFSHAAYTAISLVLAGLFLRRRQPADIALAALQLAGVAFTASFFIITIACDYRYLYFADLAAIAGLIYAAVDPIFARRST